MIKAITELDKLEPELKEKVLHRLREHPSHSELCFHTPLELQDLARREHSFYMSSNPTVHQHFLNSLTNFEQSCLYVYQRTNRKSKMEQTERRIKTVVQKTTRLTESLMSVIEKEQELQAQIDELQNARTRVVAPVV